MQGFEYEPLSLVAAAYNPALWWCCTCAGLQVSILRCAHGASRQTRGNN